MGGSIVILLMECHDYVIERIRKEGDILGSWVSHAPNTEDSNIYLIEHSGKLYLIIEHEGNNQETLWHMFEVVTNGKGRKSN
jgi:hypothetical protein